MTDLLVLGSGIAGLSAAIHAARRGLSVTVLTKGELATSATSYAQGGVAAALEEPDTTELHQADTLTAGAGLCDVDAVRILVSEGPDRVRELMDLGAVFDRIGGELALAREGGHSLARVVHAGGDATGAEIERALAAAVPGEIEVREGWFTTDLVREHGRCAGVRAVHADGSEELVTAGNVLLATGGAGQLFEVTTNPRVSTGDGLAMAWRAGAAIADVEFMQFHPTALHHPSMPRPLLSEALRGDGAVLRDEQGVAFMADEHPLADLAPRDVVARAIARRLVDRNLDHLWLDATVIADFPTRFPTIWRATQAIGLDPREDWLPVAPAAHYLSGGVCADLDGATTIPGLWACGEVACSGVHGANRLASNSLLDGLVFAPRAVEAIIRGKRECEPTGVLRGFGEELLGVIPAPVRDATGTADPAPVRAELQHVMTMCSGVLRDRLSLEEALTRLAELDLAADGTDRDAPSGRELRNLVAVGKRLADAALVRTESRGTHTRLDFPETSEEFRGRLVHVGPGDPSFVPLSAEVTA
jgi:L-aspartate oxidase